MSDHPPILIPAPSLHSPSYASPTQPPVRAWVILTLALVAMSSGAIFVRCAQATPLAKAAWRVGLAAAIALPVALWLNPSEFRRLKRAQWLEAALSGTFLALHFITWMASLDRTAVASSVLLVNTTPIWIALFAPAITGDRLRGRGWLGVALAFVGTAVAGLGEIRFSWNAFTGDLLALAGGACAAFYLMLGRRLRRQTGVLTYVATTYSFAALVLWLLVAVTATRVWGFAPGTWAAFFGMALVSQHLGHSGYNYALRFITPGALSVMMLSEPVFSGLAAWFCFGEVPPARLAITAALLLPGIWLVTGAQNNADCVKAECGIN